MIPVGVGGSTRKKLYSAFNNDASNPPSQSWATDPTNYILGQNLRFSRAGKVTAVGFRRGLSDPTTSRKLYLWDSSTSTLLVNVASSGESGTGWVWVECGPISVNATDLYVAGYQRPTNSSYRSVNNASWPVTNGPVSAISSGVYTITMVDPPGSTPPNNSYQTSNYFADVKFR